MADKNPYEEKLRATGSEVVGQFLSSGMYHLIKCMHCGHEREVTPISVVRAFKQFGTNGCPICAEQRKYGTSRQKILKMFEDVGLKILTEGYTGTQTTTETILVQNMNCGHEFEVAPGNILHRGVECSVCGIQNRTNQLQRHNNLANGDPRATWDAWKTYKAEVMKVSRKSYKLYKDIINPNNLAIGNSGVEGAHHKDHIVSILNCYNAKVPVELAGHYTNLQMLPWSENLLHKAKMKCDIDIPELLKSYFII
jgi:hypothetical protein